MKLYTIAATPHYRVVGGFISRFPEEKSCRNVSPFLHCSSLYKATGEAHTTVYLCLFIWISLTGFQHCNVLLCFPAHKEVVIKRSKQYYLQILLFEFSFHVLFLRSIFLKNHFGALWIDRFGARNVCPYACFIFV